ncbi:MAG: Fanconi anemia protein FancD2 nuclease-domain-containing protein [Benjaminiella poitrasii]|nr:MAG: Fanconi anemia protein FancD2 nuclease-domain-containing protein [Benjaminiella poitrasii]
MMVPMCSIFNLIQSCEKQLNNGSLVEVDALFGCSIVMFNADNLDDLSTDEIEFACDMLFYAINWFRELLNAFMFTKEENYRIRIISRLRSILEMENLLSNLMELAQNYAPLEFHNVSPIIFDEQGHTSNNQIISSSIASSEEEGSSTLRVKSPKKEKSHTVKFGSVHDIRPYMRAFRIHILEILRYNEEVERDEDKMNFEEINYILKDLDQKMDIKIISITPSTNHHFGRKIVNTNEDKYPSCNSIMLSRIETRAFMKKLVLYLPFILQTLENLYAEVQSKDIEPGRIQGSEELVLSISLIFNILYKMLCWNEIQNSDNSDILKEIIHVLAKRTSDDSNTAKDKQAPFKVELEEAFQYLSNYGAEMPQATSAVLLFKTLQRLMSFSEGDEASASAGMKQDTLKVVEQIITTPWFDWRDIKKEIPFLFEQFIELNEDPLSILHNIVDVVLPEFEEEQRLEQYPLLKEETIVQHYQATINQIVKTLDLLKNTDQDTEIVLVQNARVVKIFERITNYVKIKEQKSLFGVLLKTGRAFIEQFTKYSIPYFTKVFKTHTSEVVSIFKDFQSSTRMLQIMCSHVKVLKEVQLSSYVPPLKKALEIVIYQVKMLLIENRIPSSAFFMGALKHRDIHGAEISSQIPREAYDDDVNNLSETEEEQQRERPEMNEDDASETSSLLAENNHSQKNSKKAPSRPLKQPKAAKRRNKSQRKSTPLSDDSSTVSGQRPYRTSSVMPSSSEEDEEGSATPREGKRRVMEIVQAEESEAEEEEVLEFNLNSDDEDEDGILPPSLSPSPPPPVQETPTKKRRLGIGRSTIPSQKKVFNLTNHSSNK